MHGEKQDSTGNLWSIKNMSAIHTEGRYIKDAAGYIIFLRGVCYALYTDSCSGCWWPKGGDLWDCYDRWCPENCREHLRVMAEEWGINHIMLGFDMGWWESNSTWNSDTPYRETVRNMIRIAAEYGIYVSISPFQINGSYASGDCPMNNYSKQGFINAWLSVSRELRNEPNVLWLLWCEPACENMDNWFKWCHDTITALRNDGDDHIAIIQYGYNGPIAEPNEYGFVDRYLELGYRVDNVAFCQNIFHESFTYDCTIPEPATITRQWVKNCLIQMGYQHVTQELNLPVIVEEIGATDQKELDILIYEMDVLNEFECGYALWDWRPDTQWRPFDTTDFSTPNEKGQALIDAIATGVTLPPPPLPAGLGLLALIAITLYLVTRG